MMKTMPPQKLPGFSIFQGKQNKNAEKFSEKLLVTESKINIIANHKLGAFGNLKVIFHSTELLRWSGGTSSKIRGCFRVALGPARSNVQR